MNCFWCYEPHSMFFFCHIQLQDSVIIWLGTGCDSGVTVLCTEKQPKKVSLCSSYSGDEIATACTTNSIYPTSCHFNVIFIRWPGVRER